MFSLISVSLLVSKTNGNELEKKKKDFYSVFIYISILRLLATKLWFLDEGRL